MRLIGCLIPTTLSRVMRILDTEVPGLEMLSDLETSPEFLPQKISFGKVAEPSHSQ